MNGEYKYSLDTLCTWTLEPHGAKGTRLSLVHSGFEADCWAYTPMSGGWRRMNAAGRFEKLLRGEQIAPRQCE